MPSLAGSFLVAKPVLQDPNFEQTVVLLLQHSGEGAFGLVVNRPAEAEGLPFPVYSGGPCPAPGLIMLHGQPAWAAETDEEDAPGEAAPGIFVGNAECMSKVASEAEGEPAPRCRMFAGYSGWRPRPARTRTGLRRLDRRASHGRTAVRHTHRATVGPSLAPRYPQAQLELRRGQGSGVRGQGSGISRKERVSASSLIPDP